MGGLYSEHDLDRIVARRFVASFRTRVCARHPNQSPCDTNDNIRGLPPDISTHAKDWEAGTREQGVKSAELTCRRPCSGSAGRMLMTA